MSILTRVQANPEIGQSDPAYLADLIAGAERWVAGFMGVALYPSGTQGYSQSGASPSTDLTGLASNSFYLDVNGSGPYSISITLANCDTGAHTATELQTQIRATALYGFDEVTVTYDATAGYTITSGRYGNSSAIVVTFIEYTNHVAQALKLGQAYGGTEYPGGLAVPTLDDIVVRMVTRRYAQTGMEGAKSGSIAGGNSFTKDDLDPEDLQILRDNYRSLKPRKVAV